MGWQDAPIVEETPTTQPQAKWMTAPVVEETPQDPRENMGALGAIRETITGTERTTPESQALPEWTTMPEMNELSAAGLKTGAGTLLANPAESVQIVQANFPGVQIRQDAKGNFILKSSIDGKDYVIPPGFSLGDIPRAVGGVLAFTPAGRAASIPGAVAGSAATQAGIEGVQAGAGGEFNPADVAIASLAGGIVPGVQQLTRAAKSLFTKPVADAVPEPQLALPGATQAAPEQALVPAPTVEETAQALRAGGQSETGLQSLATQAAPDQKVLEAAKRLKVEEYLQPDHVTTNQSFRELAQAVKSVPGSKLRAQEQESLTKIGERASNMIDELGGTTDLSKLNDTVKTQMASTIDELEKSADDAYKGIRAKIPMDTRAPASNIVDFIKGRIGTMNGIENISGTEREILRKLSPKQVKSPNVLKGTPDTVQPTYALIDDVRRDIGAATYGKGPFADAETGFAKQLYALISKDQEAALQPLGLIDEYNVAKGLIQTRKGVEDDMIAIFGKQLDQSMISKLNTATAALTKGDADKLINIMNAIPKNQRQNVAASALNTAFGKATRNGTLNFNSYANWYEGLLKNRRAHAALMSNLPPEARKRLSDLYRISDSIRQSTREFIGTGRIKAAEDALKLGDTFFQKIIDTTKKSAVGIPIEAVTSTVGLPGAGIASGISSALTKGQPKAIVAADDLLASKEFQDFVRNATTNPDAAANKLAKSSVFARFAKKINLADESRLQWIRTAIQSATSQTNTNPTTETQ